MNISQNGVSFICSHEGCVLTAYKNKGDVWTIGYGHTGKVDGVSIYEGMTITKEKAKELLTMDCAWVVAGVNSYALKKFPSLNQNQFDALCDYTYNRGTGGLQQLISHTSNIEDIPANMVIYWGSNETYKDALIQRRKEEGALFNTPVWGEPVNPPTPVDPNDPDPIPPSEPKAGKYLSKILLYCVGSD